MAAVQRAGLDPKRAPVGVTGRWTCDAVGGDGQIHQSTTLVVDSVRYSPQHSFELMVWTYFTAAAVNTKDDQSTYTETWVAMLPGHPSAPAAPVAFSRGPNHRNHRVISESPVTYVGGNGCYEWNPSGRDNFRLTSK